MGTCDTVATVWVFPELSREALFRKLRKFGISEQTERSMAGVTQCDAVSRSCRVTPTLELVLGMDPAARGRLYDWLSEYEQNSWHVNPFRIRRANEGRWFDEQSVPGATRRGLRALTIERDGILEFADLPLLCRSMEDAAAKEALVRTLFSVPSLLVTMRVPRPDRAAEVAHYWGGRRRADTLESLLRSVPPGQRIDILHLLPPMARRRLHTYAQRGQMYNCWWSALNFHEDIPDDRLTDWTYAQRQLETQYYQVPASQRAFGDVVVFSDRRGTPSHVANYIDDDVLFSKNGASWRRPWVLSTVDEVAAIYGAARVDYMRRREDPSTGP